MLLSKCNWNVGDIRLELTGLEFIGRNCIMQLGAVLGFGSFLGLGFGLKLYLHTLSGLLFEVRASEPRHHGNITGRG